MLDTIKEVAKDHIEYRKQLVKLARADMKRTYGGALGMGWAVIRPAIIIFVYWFAFSFGLRKGGNVDGYPFFLWLIAGMIPWFYMREMLTGGAGCIRRYKFLVTKIKFPISTIPTFVSMGAVATHVVLLLIIMVIYMGFGYMPTIYYLQLPFYTLLMFIFFTTWGLLAGVLSVVSRDFLNLVKSMTQALFWLSGILYNASNISHVWIRRILLINPITIIVDGYRKAFTVHQWFWEDRQALINFAVVYGILFLLAIWAYKKLKKDIPDIL